VASSICAACRRRLVPGDSSPGKYLSAGSSRPRWPVDQEMASKPALVSTGSSFRISTRPMACSLSRSDGLIGESFQRLALMSRSVHRRSIACWRSSSWKGSLSVVIIYTRGNSFESGRNTLPPKSDINSKSGFEVGRNMASRPRICAGVAPWPGIELTEAKGLRPMPEPFRQSHFVSRCRDE